MARNTTLNLDLDLCWKDVNHGLGRVVGQSYSSQETGMRVRRVGVVVSPGEPAKHTRSHGSHSDVLDPRHGQRCVSIVKPVHYPSLA